MSGKDDVRPGGRARKAAVLLVGVVAVGLAVLALLRAGGLERGFPLVQLVAFTPLVLTLAPVVVVAAVLLRQWWSAAIVALAGIVLAALVLPRAFEEEPREAHGPSLTVMALNAHEGQVAPEVIVDLVHEHGVDVLTLQEATPELADGLADAGLAETLPHSVDRSAPGVAGGSVHAAHPVTDLGDLGHDIDSLAQPRAGLEVPGASDPVEVVSVHPMPPLAPSTMGPWREGLRALPEAEDEILRILAGDFNATLDHAEMRGVLDRGYTDAADSLGRGLTGTWPIGGPLPAVTLDRVVVDHRVDVKDMEFADLADSEHRAVITDLILPGEPD